jgi:hypothetical protein
MREKTGQKKFDKTGQKSWVSENSAKKVGCLKIRRNSKIRLEIRLEFRAFLKFSSQATSDEKLVLVEIGAGLRPRRRATAALPRSRQQRCLGRSVKSNQAPWASRQTASTKGLIEFKRNFPSLGTSLRKVGRLVSLLSLRKVGRLVSLLVSLQKWTARAMDRPSDRQAEPTPENKSSKAGLTNSARKARCLY